MKTVEKSKNLKRKSEFRFHSVIAKTSKGEKRIKDHPTYVFFENGDIYIYVELTHSETIPGKILIKLRKNPNPKDLRDSYYIEEICEDKASKFGRKKNNWVIDEKDDEAIRELVKNKKPL